MKIVFYIANYPGYGGIEKVTTYLANLFVQKGHDIKILSYHSTLTDKTLDDENGEKLSKAVQLNFFPNKENFLAQENKLFVNDFLFGQPLDLVIYQDSYVPDISQLIDPSRFAKRNFKFVVVEHNLPTCHIRTWQEFASSIKADSLKNLLRIAAYPLQRMLRKPRVVKRHKLLLDMCDRYIVLAKAYIPLLQQIVGEQQTKKILAIPNPTTIAIPSEIPSKQKQCLFVARLERDKGVDLLVDIWQKFSVGHPDWELIIVGTGRYTPLLSLLVASGKLPHTTLAGFHHDMRPYYQEANFLLMTSRFEGWPLVLQEAMAYGCLPVAYNSYGALPEIITDSENGLVVPPFHQQTFVEKMALLADEPNIDELRTNAVRRARELQIEQIYPLWQNCFADIGLYH